MSMTPNPPTPKPLPSKIVDIGDGQTVEFPGDMADDQVSHAVHQHFMDQSKVAADRMQKAATGPQAETWAGRHPYLREGLLGYRKAFGIPETDSPLTDIGRSLYKEATDPAEIAKNLAIPGYPLFKAAYGLGKQLLSSGGEGLKQTLSPSSTGEERAHGVGELAGTAAQGVMLGKPATTAGTVGRGVRAGARGTGLAMERTGQAMQTPVGEAITGGAAGYALGGERGAAYGAAGGLLDYGVGGRVARQLGGAVEDAGQRLRVAGRPGISAGRGSIAPAPPPTEVRTEIARPQRPQLPATGRATPSDWRPPVVTPPPADASGITSVTEAERGLGRRPAGQPGAGQMFRYYKGSENPAMTNPDGTGSRLGRPEPSVREGQAAAVDLGTGEGKMQQVERPAESLKMTGGAAAGQVKGGRTRTGRKPNGEGTIVGGGRGRAGGARPGQEGIVPASTPVVSSEGGAEAGMGQDQSMATSESYYRDRLADPSLLATSIPVGDDLAVPLGKGRTYGNLNTVFDTPEEAEAAATGLSGVAGFDDLRVTDTGEGSYSVEWGRRPEEDREALGAAHGYKPEMTKEYAASQARRDQPMATTATTRQPASAPRRPLWSTPEGATADESLAQRIKSELGGLIKGEEGTLRFGRGKGKGAGKPPQSPTKEPTLMEQLEQDRVKGLQEDLIEALRDHERDVANAPIGERPGIDAPPTSPMAYNQGQRIADLLDQIPKPEEDIKAVMRSYGLKQSNEGGLHWWRGGPSRGSGPGAPEVNFTISGSWFINTFNKSKMQMERVAEGKGAEELNRALGKLEPKPEPPGGGKLGKLKEGLGKLWSGEEGSIGRLRPKSSPRSWSGKDEWMKDNMSLSPSRPGRTVVFHGTSTEALPHILREGLTSSPDPEEWAMSDAGSMGIRKPKIANYVATDPNTVQGYANWSGGEDWRGPGVVLELEIPNHFIGKGSSLSEIKEDAIHHKIPPQYIRAIHKMNPDGTISSSPPSPEDLRVVEGEGEGQKEIPLRDLIKGLIQGEEGGIPRKSSFKPKTGLDRDLANLNQSLVKSGQALPTAPEPISPERPNTERGLVRERIADTQLGRPGMEKAKGAAKKLADMLGATARRLGKDESGELRLGRPRPTPSETMTDRITGRIAAEEGEGGLGIRGRGRQREEAGDLGSPVGNGWLTPEGRFISSNARLDHEQAAYRAGLDRGGKGDSVYERAYNNGNVRIVDLPRHIQGSGDIGLEAATASPSTVKTMRDALSRVEGDRGVTIEFGDESYREFPSVADADRWLRSREGRH